MNANELLKKVKIAKEGKGEVRNSAQLKFRIIFPLKKKEAEKLQKQEDDEYK